MMSKTAPRAECVNGDGAAAGSCSICNDPICEACIAGREPAGLVCKRCAYREALGSVDQDAAARRRIATLAADQARRPTGARRRGVSLAVLLGLLVLLAGWAVPYAMEPFHAGRPYARGDTTAAGAPGLDACIEGLWKVRGALDRYLETSGGALPQTLSDLQGAPARCPGCGGRWTYERGAGGGYRIACPHPDRHGRAALFLDGRIGPPQVELHAGGGRR